MKATLLLLLLTLPSCFAWHHTPPATREDHSREVVKLPYDVAWAAVVEWFANRNIPMEKMEKSSGMLSMQGEMAVGQDVVDAGEIDVSWSIGGVDVRRFATINVLMRPAGETRTTVAVNVFGRFAAYSKDFWWWSPQSLEGQAASTGKIEQSILSAMRDERLP